MTFHLMRFSSIGSSPIRMKVRSNEMAEIATIETEIKNKIKETVRNLLPDVDKGTNPYPHIVVETPEGVKAIAGLTIAKQDL